jgi:propionyl-CoA carboxylase alpha chain/3-methylcrotonyl-CoA carboxylase alpha subunit/acetyl-CoA/propionyl-CoA carboxylase biotin carboxyl carrier protein
LAVSAGHPLAFKQDDVRPSGHAIEARLYAEAPERDFAPTTGRVLALKYPEGDGVRVDSGIAQGQLVTTAFDPMLAKIIVHAPTRSEAIARARRAIEDFVLLGCETNAAFLGRILGDEGFKAGEVHTGYLDEHPGIAKGPAPDAGIQRQLLAAAALLTRPARDAADAIPSLHASLGSWRN